MKLQFIPIFHKIIEDCPFLVKKKNGELFFAISPNVIENGVFFEYPYMGDVPQYYLVDLYRLMSLYEKNVFEKLEGIPDNLRAKMLDASVFVGISNAIKILQIALNNPQTGKLRDDDIIFSKMSLESKILTKYCEIFENFLFSQKHLLKLRKKLEIIAWRTRYGRL